MLGLLSIPYTAIPQQEVIIPGIPGGMASYATITTDSYLSQALQGMMQNAAGYVGWSLAQWIQAFTAQALQRCTAYPASCSGPGQDAETLGTKYGTIAYNLMSGYNAPVQQQQSNPNLLSNGPATGVIVPTPINSTQNGPNNAFGPQGTPNSQVDTPSQQGSGDQPNINPNNVNQGVLAQTGGLPPTSDNLNSTTVPSPINTNAATSNPISDPIASLENYTFSMFGMQLNGLQAVLGIAAIGVVGMMLGSGKKGRY